MDAETVIGKLKNHFSECGFNLFLTIDPDLYNQNSNSLETIFPQAESIILVGFAGNKFWRIFQNYLDNNPGFKDENIDLIDSYSILKLSEAASILEQHKINCNTFYPFGENALDLNFVKLAELGGAGVPSLIGILLHPVYGTWISLRGALITDFKLTEYDGPLEDFAPCPSCSKPCIQACPASTITDEGWDWEACMKFRINDKTCAESCTSRLACPYGKEEQYSPEQIQYHHEFVLKSVKDYYRS